MSIPDGPVTAADVYHKLEFVTETLVRLEERVKVLPDFESRLRVLERFRYTLLGMATLAGTASGVISGLLSARGH